MSNFLNDRRSDDGAIQRNTDHRNPSERDLARLIHSAAFRRLQAKTQVLGIGEGDFHRTRLTHSMEVAQIGKGIVNNLRFRKIDLGTCVDEILPDSDLIFCIGLAHDIGHPPFGHGGEVALNYCMRQYGGFEGNGQTLRILSKLESHTQGYGLDLTRRTLLGILKYPMRYSSVCKTNTQAIASASPHNFEWIIRGHDWKPPKCFHDCDNDVVDWIMSPFEQTDRAIFQTYIPPTGDKHGKTKFKSLDTTIMDLADDISYGVHDLEDAIALGLINKDNWCEISYEIDSWGEFAEIGIMTNELFGDSHKRKRAIGALVHSFIVNSKIDCSDKIKNFHLGSKVTLKTEARIALDTLTDFVRNKVIFIPEVQTLEFRGQHMIIKLFEAISSDPDRFLKPRYIAELKKSSEKTQQMRVICDYIAGMTDEFATRLYERMFQPRQGTVFQRL